MSMKTPLVVLAAAFLLIGGITFVVAAEVQSNGPSTSAPTVILAKATKGKAKATAAINSDGTVAGCFKCNPLNTFRVATGQYQIDFTGAFPDVTANNGHGRWVQPDTLGGGQFTAFCTSADRVGIPTAVFVQCTDANGAFLDSSFFLFVSK